MHSLQPIVAVSKSLGPMLVPATAEIDYQFSNRFRGDV